MKHTSKTPYYPPPKQQRSILEYLRYFGKKVLRADRLMAPYIEKHHAKIASIRGETTYFYQKAAVIIVSARLAPRMAASIALAWKNNGQILTSATLTKDMAIEEWLTLYQGYLQRIEADCGMEAFKKMNESDRVARMNRYTRREIITALIVMIVYIIKADWFWDKVNAFFDKFK